MSGFFADAQVKKPSEATPPGGFLASARAFCAARPDREHEIAVNRLVLCFAIFSFVMCSRLFAADSWARDLPLPESCMPLYGVPLFAHLVWRPGASPIRRVVGIFCDTAVICYTMHVGGPRWACLFPLLLWTIFGNGFRFGIGYLFIATAAVTVGFAAMASTSEFWSANPYLSLGLMAGLVVLPAYTAVLIRQLSEAKRLAEQSNKAKTLFLASVSHELRTPLNAIIGLSDLLTDSSLDDDQVDMARVIGRSGRSLLALINSILDISRMEFGQKKPKADEVDLFAFLRELRDMLSVQAKAKNLRLGLYIDPETPRFLALCRNHMEEVLVNLVGNALKFTERGHVMIRVGAAPADGRTCELRIEVVDTGIGIESSALGRIFDRFSQADETIIDRFGGTGLGLAIVKQLVEGMGGSIDVSSVVGAGSVFRVALSCAVLDIEAPRMEAVEVDLLSFDPELEEFLTGEGAKPRVFANAAALLSTPDAAGRTGSRARLFIVDARGMADPVATIGEIRAFDADAPVLAVFDGAAPDCAAELQSMLRASIRAPFDRAAVARLLAVANPCGGSAREAARTMRPGDRIPLKILVAEDNRTNQMVIRKILERGGHAVAVVDDGQMALERLSEESFDLALMDLNMPVLNGIDAAKLYQYSASPEKRTPLAALTADVTDEARQNCLDAGMIACITKPVEPDRFIEWLDEFARERQTRSEPGRNEIAPPPPPRQDVAPIDRSALADLRSLGGDVFVSEIVDQFLLDAAAVLKNLHVAVEDGDVQKFRDEAHALRSCAANVGAQRVYKLCLDSRAIDARSFAVEGELRIRRLEEEFGLARDALACFQRTGGGC
jgi:two-component system sensor histidine kinase RpfC